MVMAVTNYELGYQPVPKAGCTSVKTMLTRLIDIGSGMRRAIRANPDRVHGFFPTQRYQPGKIPSDDGLFRFTVVRDPVARLLAVYTDRVLKRDELANSANIRRGRVDLPANPDPDFFFVNFEAYKASVSVIKHHAMKQVVYTGTDLSRFDLIYTLDQIGQLGQDLAAMTGKLMVVPHLNASPVHLNYADLGPKAQELVRAHCAEDYAVFGDRFTAPWA